MYLAEVKAVAFAVIPAVIVPRLYFTRTQTNAILDDTVYTIPRSTTSVLGTSRPLYGWGRDYATDFWVSLCSMQFMAVLRAG